MIDEFKKFIARGNVMDLAVAIIMGAAFGKIVNSFVADILMPPVGVMLGRASFNELFVTLSGGDFQTLAEAKAAGAATINYGIFIQAIIDFLIIAFAIFLIVRQVNRMKEQPEKEAETRECPFCIAAIPIRASRCPSCTSQLSA